MKKLNGLLITLLFSLVLSGCGVEKEPLIASGHPEWEPIMERSENKIVGAGPELVEIIFDDLGIKVSSEYKGTWDVVQEKTRTGEIDVLVAAYKTPERETYMEYSLPYVKDPIAVFINTNNTFKYTEWADLINKKGITTTGDSYGEEFDSYIEENLEVGRVATTKEAFDMLEKEEIDYFIYALYSGNNEIKKQTRENIEALELPVTSEDFYITISKKSEYIKYMPKINDLIKKYVEDGTVSTLLKKYE